MNRYKWIVFADAQYCVSAARARRPKPAGCSSFSHLKVDDGGDDYDDDDDAQPPCRRTAHCTIG